MTKGNKNKGQESEVDSLNSYQPPEVDEISDQYLETVSGGAGGPSPITSGRPYMVPTFTRPPASGIIPRPRMA